MSKVKKEILVDGNPFEKRVALIEDGTLAEFYVERKKERGYTGNIYKGKVVRVLPGMEAAFVEVGLERTVFLHTSDIRRKDDKAEGTEKKQYSIKDLIKEGQEIVVQITKEPIGTKGARVTTYLSLPGRFLVYMPTFSKTGVSRRIEEDDERKRLKKIVKDIKPEGGGLIVRTVSEGATKEELRSDVEFLQRLWKTVEKRVKKQKNPSIVYEELDLSLRMIRDVFSNDFDSFIIDSKYEYERAKSFVDDVMPALSKKVKLHDAAKYNDKPLFDTYGIEVDLVKAFEKNVYLKSGGHIVIDRMEALTAIDINTGKYVGKSNSEATIFKTNLEAVDEVTRQLRLRNVGGIIVIDFIDMLSVDNREKVYQNLKDALKFDKAKTNILKISELGIVEMTRKRTRETIGQSLLQECPYCDGQGLVKTPETVIMEIYREALQMNKRGVKKLTLFTNPLLKEKLSVKDGPLEYLKKNYKMKIKLKSSPFFHQEEYEIF